MKIIFKNCLDFQAVWRNHDVNGPISEIPILILQKKKKIHYAEQ